MHPTLAHGLIYFSIQTFSPKSQLHNGIPDLKLYHLLAELSQAIYLTSLSLFLYLCACVLPHFSRVRLFATSGTVACQAPLSMGFSRQGYWLLLLLLSRFSRVRLCRRRQPSRLRHPWDSPGKNTGVGCHFLLQCMKVKVKSLSRVRLFATPGTVACQAPLSTGFSRQGYWSGWLFPSPRDLPNPGIKSTFLMTPALAGGFFTSCTTWEVLLYL